MKLLIISLSLFVSIHSFAKDKNCTYQFEVDKSEITGTGFKFTEKTAVKASFSGFKLNQQEKKKSKKDLLSGLEVTVDLMTIDSGNALRDNNLRESLFANILGDSVATVTVKKVTDKKIETDFKLNNKTENVNFDYSFGKDQFIIAKAQIDFFKFALNEQIESLKKRCGSLHTGSDGKSVTWTTFDLVAKAKIKEICQ